MQSFGKKREQPPIPDSIAMDCEAGGKSGLEEEIVKADREPLTSSSPHVLLIIPSLHARRTGCTHCFFPSFPLMKQGTMIVSTCCFIGVTDLMRIIWIHDGLVSRSESACISHGLLILRWFGSRSASPDFHDALLVNERNGGFDA